MVKIKRVSEDYLVDVMMNRGGLLQLAWIMAKEAGYKDEKEFIDDLLLILWINRDSLRSQRHRGR